MRFIKIHTLPWLILKGLFKISYEYLFYRKKINLSFMMNEDKLSYKNQAYIFNAIIFYLNTKKLNYLKDYSFISDIVYKNLQDLLKNKSNRIVHDVDSSGSILKLNFNERYAHLKLKQMQKIIMIN